MFQVGQVKWLMCCSDEKVPEQPDGSLFKAVINDLRAFFSLVGSKHCTSMVLQQAIHRFLFLQHFSLLLIHLLAFCGENFKVQIFLSSALHMMFLSMVQSKLLCFLHLLKVVYSIYVLRKKIEKSQKLLLSKPSNT